MKIILFLIFFLLLGAFFIISNENLRLNNKENLDRFIFLYNKLIINVFDKSVKSIGYVVNNFSE